MYVFSNNSSANLAAAISDTATSIQVTTGKSQLFHYIPSGRIYYQLATITDNTNYEIVKITLNSHTDTMTVVRGVNGTTAVAWPAGSVIEARLDAATLQMFPQLNYSTDLFDEMHPNGVDLQAGRSVATDCAAGDYSVAIGYSAKASEEGAIAIGHNVDATGLHTTAVGDTSSAAGLNGTALGYLANASATNATALGVNAAASNGAAVAIGSGVIASGDSAVAICNGADATGESAIAIGKESTAAKQYDIVIGLNAADSEPSARQNSHPYVANDLIVFSGGFYRCVTAGTSAGSPPSFTANRLTNTTDGDAVWQYVGASGISNTPQSVVIGRSAKVFSPESVSVGANAVSGNGSVAIGVGSVSIDTGTAVGVYSECHGEYGAIAVGPWAIANGANNCIAIGADTTNNITDSHVIGVPSLVQKTAGSGQENYLMSGEKDLLQTAADDIATFSIPSGARFFPNEVGVIVTAASAVTVQPQVSFGITGNATALKTQTATTKSAVGGRDVWSPSSGDGLTTTMTASLKVSGTATTLKGRFYIKGLLIEDQ